MARTKKVNPEEVPKKSNSKRDFIYSIGRRKEAVARVRLYSNETSGIKKGLSAARLPDGQGRQGEILINDKRIEEYFPGELAKTRYLEPFKMTDTQGKFAFSVRVSGGGINSQLVATILGISKALVKTDEKFKPILRKRGFLTTDARVRERRKVGTGGKARRKKQSPKR